MRISTGMFYRMSTKNLASLEGNVYEAARQASSGLKVEKASDDPIGMINATDAHLQLIDLEQYAATNDHVRDWLSAADSAMQNMETIMYKAKNLAEQMATGTMTDEAREAAAAEIEGFIDDLLMLANTGVAGDYIFAGTNSQYPAASLDPLVDGMAEGPSSASGHIYGMGTYTGTMSRTIELTIGAVTAGTPDEIDYSYLDDYGRTVTGTATVTGTGTGFAVDIGDGVKIYIDGGTFATGDTYTLGVGRQQGNDEDILANLSWENRMDYNFTMSELLGREGNTGGGWASVIDQLVEWADYMTLDNKDQDSYPVWANTYNNPTSTGGVNLVCDFQTLQDCKFEFNVGGPFQSQSEDADLADYRNFTVDAAYAGGVPSAGNPMTVNYEWWDGAAWVPQTAVITDVGEGNAVALAGGETMYVANASYSAGDGPFELSPVYPEDTEPSPTNPMTMTYTYRDPETGVRMYGTVTFTGTGEANSVDLDPPGDVSLFLDEGGTFDDFDGFTMELDRYGQGQAKSQEMLEALESHISGLLQYTADAGARINRLDVRATLLDDDNLRLADRLEANEDADITEVITNWKYYEMMYQAALSSTSLVSSVTLADYL